MKTALARFRWISESWALLLARARTAGGSAADGGEHKRRGVSLTRH